MIIQLLPGDTQSLAGEEPPLAGIVRCTQGDNRKHPGDSDTLLHGLQTCSGVSYKSVLHVCMSFVVLQRESAKQRVLVAILHPAGEPG